MADRSVERRLAAILAADVAGYSRAMEADEVGTHGRLKALRREVFDPKVVAHRGRIVKTTGDGALVEFSSSVDALNCAVDLQRALAGRNEAASEAERLLLRIGINIGDIIIDGEDIYGTGVNVAARLEALAEPGGICISGRVLEQVEKNVDAGFAYLGPQSVKNIERPVKAWKVLLDAADAGKLVGAPEEEAGAKGPVRLWQAAAGLAIIIAAGAGLWVYQSRPDVAPARTEQMAFPLPDKPSIAVLPFDNFSGEPEQGYFADGITEDLITDLSKIQELFVIARNSTFAYEGRAVPVREVAEELGVRYVLEGSVRRAGDEVRINAQLIDAVTGGHVWAERFDGHLANVFDLQDKVTAQVVDALALKLTQPETGGVHQKTTTDPEAYDAFLKGWEHYRRDTPEQYAKALDYFQRATELDPEYDRAIAAIAAVYWDSYRQGWYPVLGLERFRARALAQEYLARVKGKPIALAHQVESRIELWRGKHEAAIAAAERAVSLDRSDADGKVALAAAVIFGGEAERAASLIEVARRQDPRNQSRYIYLEGLAHYQLEEFEAAAEAFERTLELNPELWNPEGELGTTWCSPCTILISTYGHLGRKEKAEALVRKIERHWAGFSISGEIFLWPFEIGEDMNRFEEGLRKAGVDQL